MTLAVDAGNSNVAFARLAGDEIVAQLRLSRQEADPSGIGKAMEAMGSCERGILSSVAPEMTPLLVEAMIVHCGSPPHQISHASPHRLLFDVPDPSRAGSDRIATACGALLRAVPPLVVVDCGTATTFTLIDAGENGEPIYRGGAIAPGGGTALAALANQAPHLPEPRNGPLDDVGDTTEMALAIGNYAGHAALVDALVERLFTAAKGPPERGENAKLPLIITGGWAPFCIPHLRQPHLHRPHLLFEGLAALARRLDE